MVVFYLRNSRIPDGKIVPVTVSLDLPALKSTASGTAFPDLKDSEIGTSWILTLDTPETNVSGNQIPTEVVNIISENTVHIEIEAALGRLGNQIDWGTPLPDTQPPRLLEITPPLDQTTGVSIFSNIIARIQDPLPAAGIDLSTLNMRLNDFPIITSGIAEPGKDVEFRGNVFDLTVIHRPKRILT